MIRNSSVYKIMLSYPKTPTASRRILSESKDDRFSGRKVAELRGCLSCCTAAKTHDFLNSSFIPCDKKKQKKVSTNEKNNVEFFST